LLALWITLWSILLIGSMSIGGYFMFRKFLKALPKADGKSKLDWQNYYVEASRHLWTEETKAFLDKLVQPVPKPFRDVAKHSIAAKIGQVALESGARQVEIEHCVEGYILATPRRDYKSLVAFLNKNNIDYTKYKHIIEETEEAEAT